VNNSKNKSIWRIIPFEENNAYFNMAADEAIFRCYPKHQIRTLRFYGWKPSAVSIGQHQKLDDEIDFSMVEKLNFHAVRRPSGGGAVFHDAKGELTYSVITSTDYLDTEGIDENYYEIIRLIFEPLVNLGVSIDMGRIHCPSVFSNDKKISGNAQARSGNTILQHGTILIDYDPNLMYSVLKARPGKTRSDMVASVYQKITTISQQIQKEQTPCGLADYIIKYLIDKDRALFKTGSYLEDEIELMNDLISSKYKTTEWIYLR
jgi:lipoate-protein ligase A